MKNILKIGAFILLLLSITNCEDPWQKHISESDLSSAKYNLIEIIKSTPELTRFAELIESANLTTQFELPGNYTVWAPSNSALASLDDAIVNDSKKLKAFINNHISSSFYALDSKHEMTRCKMVNDKHVNMDMSTPSIEGETITGTFNTLATNGVIHTIDQKIDLRPNIWEFIENTDLNLKQTNFLNSLTDSIFNDSIATLIGFDPLTSQPLYDTLSGLMWHNEYVSELVNVRSEDSLFTFILIDDDVFDLHYDRFSPYYKLKATDERDPVSLSKLMVCYDLVGSGIQPVEFANGYLNSITNKSIPFESSAVINTYKVSNGIIYHINACDLSLEEKFPPIYIEGESLNKFVYTDGGKTGYTRVNPLARSGFDFVLDDHDANPGRIVYNAGMVAAAKYEFYWVAVDDFNSTYYGYAENDMIRQKLEKVINLEDEVLENRFPVHYSISDSLMYVTDTTYDMATEHLVGTTQFTYYEDLWIHLIGSAKNTSLTLDYIKLKPVFDE